MPTRSVLSVVILGLVLASGRSSPASDETVNPDLILRSLIKLERELSGATSAGEKESISNSILEIGRPLTTGVMSPSSAGSVATALKTHATLPSEQRGYHGFWLLRALAAVHADDEQSGKEAASVLQKLRTAKSAKASEIDVMAALNVKGWLFADDPANATKSMPFVNSLGMTFVPVSGTSVVFCMWDTRVKDFDEYVQAVGVRRDKPRFRQTEEHPVVNVSWEDATAFCDWLSNKEGRTYRLPTDLEWSAAIGLDGESGRTPDDRDGRAPGYPWGSKWPPPIEVGNYSPSMHIDNYPQTSPVGSFRPNQFGLFDMGGNVMQWCQDWYDSDRENRVMRGSSWYSAGAETLRSSGRGSAAPRHRNEFLGFRVVMLIRK